MANKITLIAFSGFLTSLPVVVEAMPIVDDRDDFVSDASYIVGTYTPKETSRTPEDQKAAAEAYLSTFAGALRERAQLDLDDPERQKWTNVPAPADAGGVRFGEFNEAQTKAACDLLAALLSDAGYQKMVQIMLADDQLLNGGRARRGFGTEYFSIVVFGTPSTTEPWAIQLDGHHVALNLSMKADMITMSPSFIGTQPESFKIGDSSYRPLAKEIDLAYKLMGSLSDEQLEQAITSNRRGAIRTGPGTDGQVPTASGVVCKSFNDEQREILTALLHQWVGVLPDAQAEKRMKQLREEMDEIRFAWNGPSDVGSDVSYSIQGPSVIIEYACQDLGGDPLNHLHSMYRDPNNEYAGQLEK